MAGKEKIKSGFIESEGFSPVTPDCSDVRLMLYKFTKERILGKKNCFRVVEKDFSRYFSTPLVGMSSFLASDAQRFVPCMSHPHSGRVGTFGEAEVSRHHLVSALALRFFVCVPYGTEV